MLKKNAVRFGLVGAGAIAQSYLQAFKNSDAAELAAVADVREEAAEAVAESNGCEAFTSHIQMAEQVPLEAVIVCTPPVTHEAICKDLFERKLNVLCEKPLALDGTSARAMVESAAANGVRFTMASKFRYVPDLIKAKSIVTSGILGELLLLENTFAGHVDMKKRWNSQPAISGGGVLIDNGTHSIDIVRYLLGPIADVHAMEGKRIQGLEVEDTVQVQVRAVSGVIGSIDLSWSLNKHAPYYVSLYGENGTVLVGWQESMYRRDSDQDWIVFGEGYNKITAFTNQIENFAEAIHGESALIIKPDDAIASVDVIEAAYQSLQKDVWVAVRKQETPKKEMAVAQR